MKTLFSGIQPTGNLHLGNYLGAVKNWVDLQNKYSCIYSVVDLHALTGNITAKELKDNTLSLAIDLLAVGINPKKSILFRQSDVVGHTELAWIFGTLTPIAELNRMTQFKDKSEEQKNNINSGLLTYPVLQAADILLYKAEAVPIGEDQLQHLELTRVIARKFNNKYKTYFPTINPTLSPIPRVMSLNASNKKMSKSLGEPSYITLRDNKATITKKIKKAVADEAGVHNLLDLYYYFGDAKKHSTMKADFEANKLMNSKLKEELTKELIKFLKPIQTKIKHYEAHPKEVEKILANGAKQAQKIADKNLKEIKKLVGLI